MAESLRVFAIVQRRNEKDCFLEVVAGVERDGFVRIVDKVRSFPTQGTVYLHSKTRSPLPSEGQALICEVTPKDDVSAFPVSRVLDEIPLELIDLHVPSTDLSIARGLLIDGRITAHPAVRGRVLLRFSDAVVAGPVQAIMKDGVLSVNDEVLNTPLRAWPVSAIEEILHKGRHFALVRLPETERYVDLAPLDIKVHWVLKKVSDRRQELGVEGLSRQKLKAISDRLGQDFKVDWERARCDALLRAVDEEQISAEITRELVTHLLRSEQLKKELDQHREAAKQEARAQLESAKSQAMSELTEARRELNKAREQTEVEQRRAESLKGEAERQLQASEDQAESVVAHLARRIAEAKQEPAAALSEVLLLRSFLVPNHAANSTEAAKPIAALVSEDLRPAEGEVLSTPNTLKELWELLRPVGAAIGLNRLDADTLARILVAATVSGQIISLRGAMAPIAAEICGRRLGGALCSSIVLPAGLSDGRELRAFMRLASAKATEASMLSAIVIDGLNRSPPELYGEALFGLIGGRALGGFLSPVLLGTVIDGATALPPDELSRLGPVIDLDGATFRWSEPPPIRPVAVALERLNRWRAENPLDQEDELLQEVVNWEHGCPLWHRLASAAHRILRALEEKDESAKTMSAMCVGWIGPRARAVRLAVGSVAIAESRASEWARRSLP